MICAVTGHRPNKLGGYRTPNPYYNSIMEGLDRALLDLRPERVIVGMALGVDQWTAELCLWNGIPFVAAVPFEGFELGSNWPESSIVKYRHLLSRAAEVHYVCNPPYAPFKMQRRNEWMVDHCNVLLAVFDGTWGGTANCVNYAQQVRRTIRRISYRQPPPIANRENRPALTIQAAPQPQAVPQAPPQPSEPRRMTAEALVAAFLDQRPPRPPRETEGQRRARERARRDLERAEREAQLLAARAEARNRREEETVRRRIQITDVPALPPQEEEKAEVVRDFARFVDLDV